MGDAICKGRHHPFLNLAAMSYYKVINGVKYDKQLLDVAEELTTGKGDGRISEREIQLIVKLAKDGRGITPTEEATLHYIRATFKLTSTAANWFDQQFPPKASSTFIQQLQKLRELFELPGLTIEIDETEASNQNQLHNAISFEQALSATLSSFIKDGTRMESPRDLVMNVHEIFQSNFTSESAWDAALSDRVRAYMNEGGFLRLLPLRMPANEEEINFNLPEDGESTADNWIFQLSLRTLSDHAFWAVTDRRGARPTYNYGFN